MADSMKGETGGFYEAFWSDASYQQAYAFHSAVRDRFPAIQHVWGSLKAPKRVLDFGCGNGVLSYWMHSNGFGEEVVGVDVSHTGIAHGQKMFGRPGLHFTHVDTLPELGGDNAFDVVVASHVLEHIPAPEKALSLLLPMGEWYVLEVPLEQCWWPNLVCVIRGKSREDNPLGHVNFWTKASFRAFLEDHGLLTLRDYQYASAPYSPYNPLWKRIVERLLLAITGVHWYGKVMATHYVVLACRRR